MIAPRALRELSWAAAKLREVAKVLSALEVRLTVRPEDARMTAPRSVGQDPDAMSRELGGVAEPSQLRLDFADGGYHAYQEIPEAGRGTREAEAF